MRLATIWDTLGRHMGHDGTFRKPSALFSYKTLSASHACIPERTRGTQCSSSSPADTDSRLNMVASVLRRLSAFVAVYLAFHLAAVLAAPVEERALQARAAPSAPHFVVYADSYQPGVTGPPAVSAVTVRPANHLICGPTCSQLPFYVGLQRLVSLPAASIRCRLMSYRDDSQLSGRLDDRRPVGQGI